MNINEFMTSINTEGVVKSNRFEATIAVPPYLRNYLPAENNNRLMTLRCENATIPGMSFAALNQIPRLGYGAPETIPYGALFEDFTLTFLLDTKSRIHRFFYEWTNSIVNYKAQGQLYTTQSGPKRMSAYEVGYKDSYVSTITITVLDSQENGVNTGTSKKILECTAYRCYPKSIPQMNLSWSNNDELVRVPIDFSCTDFEITYFNID